MMKIFGSLLFSGAVLVVSAAMADTDKRKSGRDGVQCIDGGEQECGIAWEGKGLFNISARAEYAFTPIWDEDLDLQQAYLCCTEDQTRKNICNKTHTWVTWDHCDDYVLKFFDPDMERITRGIGFGNNAMIEDMKAVLLRPQWTQKIRDLTKDIYASNPGSASAQHMNSCMEQSSDFWSNEGEFLMEQIFEVVDVITVVEMGYGIGSFFVDKAIASALSDGLRTGLKSAESEYLARGISDFSNVDVRNAIISKYADFAESRGLLLGEGGDFWSTSFRESEREGLNALNEAMENTFKEGNVTFDELDNWADRKLFGVIDREVSKMDKDIVTYLLSDLDEVPELQADPRMLLPETRAAVNKQFLQNWNFLTKEVFPKFKRLSDFSDLLKSKLPGDVSYLMSSVGVDGYDAMGEFLKPFGDVTTNFAVGPGGATVEDVQKRFADIAYARYADDAFYDENMHNIKMGLQGNKSSELIEGLDSRAKARADKLIEAVNPQIDEWFVDNVVNIEEGDLRMVQGDAIMKAIAEKRLRAANRVAYEKLMVNRARLAFQAGLGGGGTAAMTYITKNRSEGCIAAVFDTLRDESTCLWNHAEGGLCDE